MTSFEILNFFMSTNDKEYENFLATKRSEDLNRFLMICDENDKEIRVRRF